MLLAKNEPIVSKLEKLSEKVPLKVPYGISISIGNICDFKCVYCNSNQEKPELMKLDDFKRIADQLGEFGEPVRQISFVSRGETILNKDLPLMIKIIKDGNLAKNVKVLTNDNQLTPALSDKLIQAGLDLLKISLQGISSEKYMEICRTNIDFNKFVNQIKYFYEHRNSCKLHLKVIDMALDENEEPKFYNLFGDICDYIFIEKLTGDIIPNKNYNRFNYNINNMNICPLPFYTMKIEHNGNKNPCCQVNEFKYGKKAVVAKCLGGDNIKNIKQIWNEEYKNIQLELIKESISEDSICYNCRKYIVIEKENNMLDNEKNNILGRYECLLEA